MPARSSRLKDVPHKALSGRLVSFPALAVLLVLLSGVASPLQALAQDRQSLMTLRDEKVIQCLQREFDWKMEQVPIGEVAETVSRWCNINVWVDQKALKEVGVKENVPLTFHGRRVSVEVALERMLEPNELSWTVLDGLLVLTTPEVVEMHLSTRIYNVRDLLAKSFGSNGRTQYDFDTLIEIVTNTVQPNTWDMVGGPGSIKEYYNDFDVALVISQTSDVHNEIDELFRMLRLLPSSNHRLGLPGRTKTSAPPATHRTVLAPAWPAESDSP